MLDQEILLQTIEGIGLEHMDIDIDVSHVLLDDYPNAHFEFALLLVQGYYERYREQLGDNPPKAYLLRSLDYSKFYAVQRVTKDFHNLVDRTITYLLDDADRTGWFRSDYFGHDSLIELLASIADEHTNTNEFYDWDFIVTKLLPMARTAGVDPTSVMSASVQVRKMRSAVPAGRMIAEQLEKGVIDHKVAEESVRWLFGVVSNPRISARAAQAEFDKFRGKKLQRLDPLQARRVFLPGGKSWIIVNCDNQTEEITIERALGKLVDMHMSDMTEIARSLAEMLKGNR